METLLCDQPEIETLFIAHFLPTTALAVALGWLLQLGSPLKSEPQAGP